MNFMICNSLCQDWIYNFFNNATVAAVIAVLIAGFLATRQYKKQKDLGRKYEIKKALINDIIALQEKAHAVLLIIDRIANTYQQTERSDEEFFNEDLKRYEIPKLSNYINEEIPFTFEKISINTEFCFEKNQKINKAHEEFKKELKKWHDPIAKMKISLKDRIKQQPCLSLDNFDNKIKELIDLIWKEKI